MNDVLTYIHPFLIDFLALSPFFIAIILSFIDGLIGFRAPPLWQIIKSIAAVFYKRLNREGRSVKARKTRGFIVLILFASATLFMIRAAIPHIENTLYMSFFEGFILSGFISTSAVWVSSYKLNKTPDKNKIAPLTQDELLTADDYKLRKHIITYQARSLERFLIAPLFFYFIGGLYLLVFAMTISALTFSSNFKTQHSRDYSQFIKRIDIVFTYIPARITALILCLISVFVPFASFNKTRSTINQATKFNDPNAGWSLSAYAGSLDITLAGPALQEGKSTDQPWVGPEKSSAKIEKQHVIKGLFLHFYATIMIVAFCLFLN